MDAGADDVDGGGSTASVEGREMEVCAGQAVCTVGQALSRASFARESCHFRAAGKGDRDYDDTARQRSAAGSECVRGRWSGHDGRTLSQIAVTMGQAEGGAPFLAVEAGTGHGHVSGVRAAVLRVSHRSRSGRQFQRIRIGR